MSEVMTEEYTIDTPTEGEQLATVADNGSEHEKFTITLPNKEDVATVDSFIASLQDKQAVHGVKSLLKWTHKYLDHVRLAESMWHRATVSANNINGIRGTSQLKGDKKRSLRHTAEVFYGSLSTPVLRAQCTVFGLDFDSYNSIEDVVTALVDKSVKVTVV